mmetsp:Transcript_20699/g.60203  ORF Transcript_20699/g.60203 Transcript_20699/m.60203 type:complete len:207 (+) Transcript_20699:291-911(+)
MARQQQSQRVPLRRLDAAPFIDVEPESSAPALPPRAVQPPHQRGRRLGQRRRPDPHGRRLPAPREDHPHRTPPRPSRHGHGDRVPSRIDRRTPPRRIARRTIPPAPLPSARDSPPPVGGRRAGRLEAVRTSPRGVRPRGRGDDRRIDGGDDGGAVRDHADVGHGDRRTQDRRGAHGEERGGRHQLHRRVSIAGSRSQRDRGGTVRR